MEKPEDQPEMSEGLPELHSDSEYDLPPDRVYERGWMDNAEDRENYIPGGFHPVHIGDHLGKGSRFRVITKLGNGGSATVWLCRDLEMDKYVALKIIMADASPSNCAELMMINRKDLDFDQPGGQYIALPIDHFWIEGPIGSHLCLVLPVLGPKVSVIWHTLSDPSTTPKNIALQVTSGLLFLHRNGICHGDFRPSNILLRLSNIDNLSEEQLVKELGEPREEEIYTASGDTPGPSAPEYVVEPINLMALHRQYLTDRACIIDFGESYDISTPPENLGIPLSYCSPELILGSLAGAASDIWALACTLYELRSMTTLFENFCGDENEIILQMVRLLGKLPDPWWSSWEQRDRWFTEDGTPVVNPETGNTFAKPLTIQELLIPGAHYTMTKNRQTKNRQKVDITVPPEESEILTDLLLKMLRYNPQSRATIESLLDHPWFKS